MRGRKPLPAALHVLHGGPGRRPGQLAVRVAVERAHGHNGPDELPVAPAHLSSEQLLIFDHLVAEAPRGILKPIDRTLLTCLTFAIWLHGKSVAGIDREGLLVPAGRPRSARMVPNPRIKLATQQAALIIRFASELGFSPTSRARLGISAAQWQGRESPLDEFLREPLPTAKKAH